MAYNKITNGPGSYPTSHVRCEFDTSPFLDQPLSNEWADSMAPSILVDHWSTNEYSDYMAGSLVGLQADDGLGPISLVTSNVMGTQGCVSDPQHHWHTNPRSHPHITTTWDSAIATAIHSPCPAPLSHREDSESGPSTGTLYMSVKTLYQPNPASGNTESTPVPPHVSCLTPPNTTLSGAALEAAAEVESDQPIQEEVEVPTTRRPEGTGKTCEWRIQKQDDMHTLCVWAQGRNNLPKLATHRIALGAALEVVQTIRVPVYPEHRLRKVCTNVRTTVGEKSPDVEHRRRGRIRGLLEELSRYYPLEVGQRTWRSPALLLEVLNDVLYHSTPGP